MGINKKKFGRDGRINIEMWNQWAKIEEVGNEGAGKGESVRYNPFIQCNIIEVNYAFKIIFTLF